MVPNKEQLKAAFDNCKVPENIAGLLQICVNEIIYNRLNTKAKENDRKLRSAGNYYTRAIGPLARIWEALIKAEAFAIRHNDVGKIKTAEFDILITDLMKLVSDAIRLLCLANGMNLQRHKTALKMHLDPRYHLLTGPTNPITKFLFGDNIEQRITEIFRVSQATRNSNMNVARHSGHDHCCRYPHGHHPQYQNNNYNNHPRTRSRYFQGRRPSQQNAHRGNYSNTRFNRGRGCRAAHN